MKKLFFIFFAVSFLITSTITLSSAESNIKPGDIVFAEWEKNGWYHGTVGEECGNGRFMILFDDGDTKCCTTYVIVPDVIPPKTSVLPGKAVLAQWSDGKYYPGTVSVTNEDIYNINFDDGDKGKVTLNQIRLRD